MLSALANDSFTEIGVSAYTSQRRSLLIMSRASTFLRISSTPFNALTIFAFFSNIKGMVITPIVSMPIFFATPATTGAEPVPVPPPIDAVTNTIFVPSLKRCSMSAIFFSASERPTSGFPPAPRPSPNIIFVGTGEGASDFESVLHTASETPLISSSYMFRTALQPPPPTPITLIILCMRSSTGPKTSRTLSIISFSIIFGKDKNYSQILKLFSGCKPCRPN